MSRPRDADEVAGFEPEEPGFEPAEPDLGPDERDRDLLDGSWEQDYYAGRHRTRDWHSVYVGLALLVLLSLVVPALLVLFR
jgi:hypothetical protein